MKPEINIETHPNEELKCEYNTKSLHRIHRIQGQLASLEAMIAADDGTSEERVIRARTIEKGMKNLITHLVECYLVNTARYNMESNADETTQELVRIFDLLNR